MLKIDEWDVVGWEYAIHGMRNPMNSWDKSDSKWGEHFGLLDPRVVIEDGSYRYRLGDNDIDLMMRLANAGSVHAKYRRMLTVYVDITAPLYWWKEFDTYKVGTVANSCSTMHKIHSAELSLDDFSHEHLNECSLNLLDMIIRNLNANRQFFVDTKDKGCWWQMIQLLPTSYNQKRTLMLNYEVLVGIYRDRKNHKLDEWHTLCDWIRKLPFSEIITGDE